MTAENVAAAVRDLLAQGLTVADVADVLRLNVVAVRAVCLCRVTETVRHEHPQCPKHVLDTQRRMRGEH